ncbi:hypothetical protein AVDCRST_MAG82-620, partial [uncultured Rubrobacteraceae bacterium]
AARGRPRERTLRARGIPGPKFLRGRWRAPLGHRRGRPHFDLPPPTRGAL